MAYRPTISSAKEMKKPTYQPFGVPRRRLHLVDAAIRVVDVAEDDGLGRAHRLAGGEDFAVADAAVALLGPRPRPALLRLDLRLADALHAVGTLLHHAASANCDIG